MADAAGNMSAAETALQDSKKLIHGIQKKLGQTDKEENATKKLADLDEVEALLENPLSRRLLTDRLRLATMACTFTDFLFACESRVLDRLWQAQTMINGEYKRMLQRHRSHSQIVQYRNIEKQYTKHLKTAQYFYRGFIERLSARYSLRPLQRIAHSMKAASIRVDDVLAADTPPLSDALEAVCYRTLLRLGDLARYRLSMARQKNHNPDVALMYYGLAQDLMPHEGDAHHQMAVILADQRRDFDVVYHFFRSLSVKHPNPLAAKNLTSEFKKLMQPPSGGRKTGNAPPDPYDTFGSWFVRLHAHYFKGEAFSQQAELEREVLHRWGVLLKSAEQPLYLQKAILINFAAYDVALNKVAKEWTNEGSQSCQFILQFIVRMVLTLSQTLEGESQRLFAGTPDEPDKAQPKEQREKDRPRGNPRGNGKERANENSGAGKKLQAKKGSPSGTCLSLFRICIAWIALHHDDLVNFKSHLAPHINDMHRSVTTCLTVFLAILPNTAASSAEYLLPEDTDVVGLAPLDRWAALRVADGSEFKPPYNDADVQRLKPNLETLARIFNIVECTIQLVDDASFPWKTVTTWEEGREVHKICFTEDALASPAVQMPVSAVSAPAVTATVPDASRSYKAQPGKGRASKAQPAKASSSRAGPSVPSGPSTSTAPAAPTAPAGPSAPVGSSNHRRHKSRPSATRNELPASPVPQPVSYPPVSSLRDSRGPDKTTMNTITAATSAAWPASYQHQMATNYEFGLLPSNNSDSDLLEEVALSRVQNFLTPPEANASPSHHSQQNVSAQPAQAGVPTTAASYQAAATPTMSASSYGMHSNTADDVFGQILQQQQQNQLQSSPLAPGRTTRAGSGTLKQIPSTPWDSSYLPSTYSAMQPPIGTNIHSNNNNNNSNSNSNNMNSPIRDGFPVSSVAPARQPSVAMDGGLLLSSLTLDGNRKPSFGQQPFGQQTAGGSTRGFPSALSPIGPMAPQQGQASPPQLRPNPWAQQAQQAQPSLSQQALNERQLLARQLQMAQAASLGLGAAASSPQQPTATPAGTGGSAGGNNSFLYSNTFTPTPGMPSVQSPMGLPPNAQTSLLMGAANGSPGFGDSLLASAPSSQLAHDSYDSAFLQLAQLQYNQQQQQLSPQQQQQLAQQYAQQQHYLQQQYAQVQQMQQSLLQQQSPMAPPSGNSGVIGAGRSGSLGSAAIGGSIASNGGSSNSNQASANKWQGASAAWASRSVQDDQNALLSALVASSRPNS